MSRARKVYSTGPHGSGSVERELDPGEPTSGVAPPDQVVRVSRERAGRRGKTVTRLGPLVLLRAEANELRARLQRRSASGGTMRLARTPDGRPCFEIELQGDHVRTVLEELGGLGYRVRRAGG